MLAYQLVALGGLEIENPTLHWYSVSCRITYLLCQLLGYKLSEGLYKSACCAPMT